MTKKLQPNADGFYVVKFRLLKRLNKLETPQNYSSCSNFTKNKEFVKCFAANIKLFFRNIEEKNHSGHTVYSNLPNNCAAHLFISGRLFPPSHPY